MRIYLAGPMTGKPDYNVLAFEHAAAQWRDADHEVVTPFDCNNVVWRRHLKRDFDPRTDSAEWGDKILGEMFLEDMKALIDAEAVVVLPGWSKSKGARVEVLTALNLGKPIYDAHTFEELNTVPTVSFASGSETILEEAQRLVHGDRQAAYKHPVFDYKATGRMWGAILEKHLGVPVPDIPPRICCLMMVAVKVSREAGVPKRDNRVDGAGYFECADMCAQVEESAA